MQLPEKTFTTQQCKLFESDYECNRNVKPLRVMQLLQDIATTHAEMLGLGWNTMDSHGMLWVISKIKVEFHKPVTADNREFLLYTWPIAPNRFYAERCFSAVANGEELFSATSLWSLVSRDERKLLPAEIMNDFCGNNYSSAHCTTEANFLRVRLDNTFSFCYERTIRRSDLDHNGHVNNTNYITYAVDVLLPHERVRGMEIVFHKELKLGDTVKVFAKEQGNKVFVVGVRDEMCFSAVLDVEWQSNCFDE